MAAAIVRPDGGWPLRHAADGLGVPLADSAIPLLSEWLDLLVVWNARVDLTAARSSAELVDLMVADALVLSARIPAGVKVVDVGTGAGARGLALGILRPDLAITLAEPLAKRAAFLRTVKGTLGLAHVVLDPRKGEALASSSPAAWDVALARATLAPPAWLALARELVSERGSAWVFLAREEKPAHPELAVAEQIPYRWPETGAHRTLVRYVRGAVPPG